MTKIINNSTVITNINKYNEIVTGVIKDTDIGMLLIIDNNTNITQQLQFNTLDDINHIIDKLNILKMQMEVNKNERS